MVSSANNEKKKGYNWNFIMKNEIKTSEKQLCFSKQNIGYKVQSCF